MARPKSFDPDEALDEAMRAFWRRGYAATSIHDLTEAMGINKFSLYSTFGDKRAVFLAALDRYTKRVVGTMLADLEAPEAGLAEIRQYFEIIVGGATRSHEVCGCLMTNSGIELAPEDAEIRRKVRKHLRRMRRAFAQALGNAAVRGGLRLSGDVDVLARHLVGCSQSLALAARTRPKAEEFRGYVDWLIESLDTAR